MKNLINYDSPSSLAAFLEERGLGMRKKFGQNFMIQPGARKQLIDALEIQAGEEVWEIGAGLGAMSAGLLERGARLTVFEIDPGFCAALKDIFNDEARFTLVEGDALDKLGKPPYNRAGGKLFGNLPYNIAAALLGRSIEQGLIFSRAVITVQREVARRIAAKPGTSDYSSLSALTACAYRVKLLSVFGGECFYPPPHVESQALRLDALPRAAPPPVFFSLLRALFAARRKTVKNNLAVFLKARHIPETDAPQLLADSCIDPMTRAETLKFEDIIRLAVKVSA